MTYDLEQVAAAVKAVAPEALITSSGNFLKVIPAWNRMKILEVTRNGYISANFLLQQDRAIVIAICAELDRQDAEHAGIP